MRLGVFLFWEEVVIYFPGWEENRHPETQGNGCVLETPGILKNILD